MKKYKPTMSQEALNNFKTLPVERLNEYLKTAAIKNDKFLIEYLLTSDNLPVHAQINYDDGFCFLNACWQGDIELVEFYLESPQLKEKADINVRNTSALRIACAGNHLELVRFLLTDKSLEGKIDINVDTGAALRTAVFKNFEELTWFLLTSEELDKKADMHIGQHYATMHAITNKNYQLVKYIIENTNEQNLLQEILEVFSTRIQKESGSNWFKTPSSRVDIKDIERLNANHKILDIDDDYFGIKIEKNSTLEFLEKLIFTFDLQLTPALKDVLEYTSELILEEEDPNNDDVQELAKVLISMFNVKALTNELGKKTISKNAKIRKL